MIKQIRKMNGAVLLGSILLIFSLTGFFTDPARLRPRPGPLDDPEGAGAVEVIPTVVTSPGFGRAAQSSIGVPLTRTPSPLAPLAQWGAPGNDTQPASPDGSDYLVPVDPNAPSTAPAGNGSQLPPLVPDRIVIPAIDLDAPVLPAHYWLIRDNGQTFQQWLPPREFAAGWQATSAYLGQVGNTVLSGHHNVYGEVFRHLVDLKPGDLIQVYSGGAMITYSITNKMILPELGEPLSVRFDNARWLLPSEDERLTLITCWPYVSNTHRLIIVAKPVAKKIPNNYFLKGDNH